MAVANRKSNVVSNCDSAVPGIYNSAWIHKAQPFISVGTVEIAAADDDASVYRLLRIPSGARIHKIEIFSDAITGGTDFDIGLYSKSDGAVVDADFFASHVDLSQSDNVPMDVTFEALDFASIESRVWELLSLAKDPFTEYDICATGNTVGSAAGTISARVEYVL